jgi:hypothetical protein
LQQHQIEPLTGSLKVTIAPSAAVSAGAQWRVDGGSWRNSGYTQSGLAVGSHTVEFKALTGWSKPGNKTVTINYNQTTNPSGTYTRQTGSLKVTLAPSAAVSAGAQWRVDGDSWHNNADTQSGLSVGSHTVEFKAISGWAKPGNKTVTINANQTTNADGTYAQLAGSFPLVSITSPTSNPTYSTSSSLLNIGGTASDNEAVTTVSWSNSRGGSGTCSGTITWSKSGIALSSGQNIITVTAKNAAGNTATDTLTVTYSPPDTTPPTVTITTPTSGPTYSTSQSLLNIGGTASDNKAVTTVSWSNSRGGSGTCSGTSTWSKTGIALSSGQNVITVTAADAAGNTATATLTVTYTPLATPPEIVEEDSYPHDAQGMDDGTLRVPTDTSIVTRIQNDDGIDVDSVEMKIAQQSVNIRLQEIADGDDTDLWIIHTPKTPFAYEEAVNYAIDAKSLNGLEMETYFSSFKIESEEEHDAALAKTPSSTEYFDDPVIGQNTIAADPATAIQGAKIIYDHLEPVTPRFGPLEEIPDLDIVTGVGLPLNMQPANVFVKPVTVFIPCPGETDLGTLEIYVFNPAIGWQASWETDGCIVPGSRVNHGPNDLDPTQPPTIEVQLNHFSGVQAGKSAAAISPSAGAEEAAAKGGGGGGGGCFITAAARKSPKLKMDPLQFMLLITFGFVGFVGIRRKLKK